MIKSSLVGLLALLSLSAVAEGVIMLPEKPTGSERFAAQELRYHLEKATGEALTIVFEPKKADAGRRYFVGRVAALAAVGVDPAAFRAEERLVKGVGNDVCFVGGEIPDFDALRARSSDWETYGYAGGGTLYAVYDFLEKDMGVRWLWPGELGEVIPRRAVPALGEEERKALPPTIDITCHMCGKTFTVKTKE